MGELAQDLPSFSPLFRRKNKYPQVPATVKQVLSLDTRRLFISTIDAPRRCSNKVLEKNGPGDPIVTSPLVIFGLTTLNSPLSHSRQAPGFRRLRSVKRKEESLNLKLPKHPREPVRATVSLCGTSIPYTMNHAPRGGNLIYKLTALSWGIKT